MSKRRTGTPPVHTITSAPAPLGADIDRRARRYLFQMSLRTICFLGAVFTWGRVPTAVSICLLVGAVVLPYVAVVLANAGRERPERPDPFSDLDLAQLTAGTQAPGRPAGPAMPAGTHGAASSGRTPGAFATSGTPGHERPVWDEAAWRPVTETFPDGAPRSAPPRG